jgi:hypothetical protein
MENTFIEVMSKRSDVELVEILTKYKNDYQPEAIYAAETEFKKRNLSLEKMNEIEKEIKTKKNNKIIIENKPLQVYWKILVFIFPGFLNLIFSLIFKAEGYEKRYKETWKWTFYGILFYAILILILFLL